MTDELDVEAMLEAPYKEKILLPVLAISAKSTMNQENREERKNSEKKKRSRSRERETKSKDDRDRKDRDRKRSRSRERERDRDRDRDRDRRDRDRRSRSRDKDRRERKRSRSREKKRSRSKEKKRESPVKPRPSPPKIRPERERERSIPLTPEEKDARTIFCMQLAARIRSRDLEEFFSSVGKVKDVKLITDNKTRRSKGIAYVEFMEVASVPLAIGLSGQKLLGVPIIVQQSQAEKNRVAGSGSLSYYRAHAQGPMRLYVGSLHFNITEDMLRSIFEPFGKIEHINLVQDPETRRSKGFGFVTYKGAEDALKAMNQLNGFELAGRPMKVGHVTERQDGLGKESLDSDEMERQGFDLGATGRIALMAKLAEGTGFSIPQAAQNALDLHMASQVPMAFQQNMPPIATQCFMLSNMFDANTELNPNFDVEIRDDVIEECNKHGGVLHIYVDKQSPNGNVYVKCPSIASAVASVGALHGRWFAGKMITAAYVPLPNYHQLFSEAVKAHQLLMPSARHINTNLI